MAGEGYLPTLNWQQMNPQVPEMQNWKSFGTLQMPNQASSMPSGIENYQLKQGTAPDPGQGQGFNWEGAAGAFGSLAQGVGSLANIWVGLKGLKLAKDANEEQNRQWRENFDAQRTTVNNRIADQNAWKRAQGRKDFGKKV